MTTSSTTTIQVPSPEFWTITPFTVATPDGWSARQTVDQLVYMDADGEPTTNCGIQWKRVSRQLSLQQIAGMSWQVTKRTSAEATLQYSKFVHLNGVMAYLRLATITRPGDESVELGQMYAAVHGPDLGEGRPLELFEIIGHFEQANSHRSADLEAIFGSFQLLNIVRPATVDDDGAAEAKGA
ncbi:MAG: hypothetical protein AAFP84_11635 [Actinomycetota bacterium]